MKKLIIDFEDQGQDCTQFTVNFTDDYKLGEIVAANMQHYVWVGMFILSGKPEIGQHMEMSKSPADQVRQHNYAITAITEETAPPPKRQYRMMNRTPKQRK